MLQRVFLATALLASAGVAKSQSAPGAGSTPGTAAGAEHEHTDRHVRFKQIDANGDGKLSLYEFVHRPNADGSPSKLDERTIADRTARFKQGDKNGDGFLTFEEFAALSGMPLPASASGPAGH